jgi:hypothetical protein
MSLKDAVTAINAKVQAAAANASAEELAYLATAIERIGGRVSVFEIDDIATSSKATLVSGIATQTQTSTAAIEATAASANAGIAASITAMNSTRDAAVTLVANTRDSAVTTVNTTRDSAVVTINNTKDASVAAVTAVSTAAIHQAIGLPGRLMFYTTF